MARALRKLSSFLGLVEDDVQYEEVVEETPKSNVRDLPTRDARDQVRPVSEVRAATPESHIVMVNPLSFSDAERIGEQYKAGASILMNFSDCDEKVMARVVDYATGLVHGLSGNMVKITRGVFLITPNNIDAREMARATIANNGFFNQS